MFAAGVTASFWLAADAGPGVGAPELGEVEDTGLLSRTLQLGWRLTRLWMNAMAMIAPAVWQQGHQQCMQACLRNIAVVTLFSTTDSCCTCNLHIF